MTEIKDSPKRKRGRPRKDKPELAEKRRRGGQPKPLARDPRRYFYALLNACISRAQENELTKGNIGVVAEHMCALAWGGLIDTQTNIGNFRDRKPILVTPRDGYHKITPSNAGPKTYRHGNIFRPHARDIRRDIGRLEKRDPSAADWLSKMETVWRIGLERRAARMSEAEAICITLGEDRFWREIVLIYCFQRRDEVDRYYRGGFLFPKLALRFGGFPVD